VIDFISEKNSQKDQKVNRFLFTVAKNLYEICFSEKHWIMKKTAKKYIHNFSNKILAIQIDNR